jgi:TM2 domain-containing membrane protein YozV
MKNPFLAFFYSVAVPGLGQLYLGERAKGWTLLSMSAGIAVSLMITHTAIAWILMGGIYLAVMIPAALDAFQAASGRPRAFKGDSRLYVVVMLLMVGPFAIPLLWQSGRFSKTAKIVWTLAVVLIALLAVVTLTFVASSLDQFMTRAVSL